MNELIYNLWLKFINNELFFAGVIQTACKAQRNACARRYRNARFLEVADNDIKTAEIERCDYE